MDTVTSIITQLETQRDAIDRALNALRLISGTSAPATKKRGGRPKKTATSNTESTGGTTKRTFNAAIRKRMAAAQKKRWAAKKAG